MWTLWARGQSHFFLATLCCLVALVGPISGMKHAETGVYLYNAHEGDNQSVENRCWNWSSDTAQL